MRSSVLVLSAAALGWLACTASTSGAPGGGGSGDGGTSSGGSQDGGGTSSGGHEDSGGGGGTVAYKTFPVGTLPLYSVAVDGSGNVWAATSGVATQGGKATLARFVPSSSTTTNFDLSGGSDAQYPYGSLSIDATGDVWIATSVNPSTGVLDQGTALVELSSSGSILKRVTNSGPANPNPCPDNPCTQNPFAYPRSSAIDSSGNIWLLDDNYASPYVTELSPSGGVIRAVAVGGSGVDSLTIDSSGDAWVVGVADNRVVKVSSGGSLSGPFALPSSVAGGLLNLAIDKSDNLWVAAGAGTALTSGALVELSPAGTQLGLFTVPSSGTADAIAIDSAGNIWIVDDSNLRLVELSASGSMINQYPGLPTPGAAAMEGHNIAIDAAGNIWIASGNTATATGMLIEAPGLAHGPQYFPYSGPQYP